MVSIIINNIFFVNMFTVLVNNNLFKCFLFDNVLLYINVDSKVFSVNIIVMILSFYLLDYFTDKYLISLEWEYLYSE